ncbi:hypothetical protein METBIDRAFT_30777 [Metschnikowia bicuspidata var. bicuspidata NRRL YB-4993]|uniref:Uncharacterized protein n=1 Tax=Metschnikowia bicuspidata var. bicuspidata NRRL YB-4993 TaxID=869754 RepID=A0A1A0HKL8_9ASCO|nr:hypothetical protein METBIDRAFT_30777 [Metschnikowia bicuspidata var. bicuspidata NRRL YB-4993]OBA24536.1 hypothetical protein METBIDRAFT_30777 [Metschnikowia bicuspidata var. bicuspidata NRRL YB-4993]
MHEYLFQSGLRGGGPLKRLMALSRREVLFEAPQKKKKKKRNKVQDPQASSSQLSLVLILTSSRPSSSKDTKASQSTNKKTSQPIAQISTSRFYEKPKSYLETQYEKSLQKFVPVDTSEDFLPLELDSISLELIFPNDKTSPKDSNSNDEDIASQLIKIADDPKVDMLDILLHSEKENEFHVMYFIRASDSFLKKAHSLVLESNDTRGTKIYYSLIKLALKALHILIEKYSSYLNPIIELVIYHKLGIIYAKETQSLDKAEHFVNLAISLANTHNLTKLKVINEFLYCEILENINPQGLPSFFSEKQKAYEAGGLDNIADLFSLLRTNHIFLGDGSLAIASINTLSMKTKTNPVVKFLSLLCEASTNIYRGAIASANYSIEKAENLNFMPDSSPQTMALLYLTKLACCVQENDLVAGEEAAAKINEFLSLQRKSSWAGWRDDGIFCIYVPLLDDELDVSIFEVQWLNSDEFVILFYFLRGLLDILDHSKHEQTKKVFSTCLDIINIQLSQLTTAKTETKKFGISFLTDKIVRLNFLRYTVIYYKLWVEFMHESNFGGISSVQFFIDCFDGDQFTKEEMCYYKLLVSKFLYLAATYFQSHGDLNSARFYFLRIRSRSKKTINVEDASISSIQKTLGIGCDALLPKLDADELYLFLTLHLVLIAEHDLQVMAKTNVITPELKSQIVSCHSLLGDLLSELSQAFDKNGCDDTYKNLGKSTLLHSTYKIVLMAQRGQEFANGKSPELKEDLTFIRGKKLDVEDKGFFKTLLSYLLYKYSTSLEESSDMLQEVVHRIVNGDDNSCLVGMLILADDQAKSSLKNTQMLGDVEKIFLMKKRDCIKRLEHACMSVGR